MMTTEGRFGLTSTADISEACDALQTIVFVIRSLKLYPPAGKEVK